ncbi:MAG: DUF4231 domain-containing protein [Gemmatimonadales bacterium]
MSQTKHRSGPDRPRFTFRIGVVGHRWDRLASGAGGDPDGPTPDVESTRETEQRLVASARSVLVAAADRCRAAAAAPDSGYDPAPPQLALVSGLAEGADRVAAQAALEAGLELWAILPYDRETYAADFDGRWAAPLWSRPGAAEQFSALLGRASQVMTMDGGAVSSYNRYDALGRSVVSHSDLVVAIWDGLPARGTGGTANLLAEARRFEVPIVRIDPASGAAWLEDRRQEDEGRAAGLGALGTRIDGLVRVPGIGAVPAGTEVQRRNRFFRERPRRGQAGGAYRALVELLERPASLGVLLPTGLAWLAAAAGVFRRPVRSDPGEEARRAWSREGGDVLGGHPALNAAVLDRLVPAQGWLDHLATHYAGRYRSAFTAIFSLAWIAAVAAVVGLVAHELGWRLAGAFGWLELVVILAILVLSHLGQRLGWHARWVEYRLLAEQLRHLAFLWPLGATTPWLRLPAEPAADDPRTGWTGWYYRAFVRQLGLPLARFDTAARDACRRYLRGPVLDGQRRYHDRAAARHRHLHHVVHQRAEVLFGAALVVALVHVFGGGEWLAHHLGGADVGRAERLIEYGLAVVAVALPARAAALHGWAGHADFQAAALRSAAIEKRLEELSRQLDTLAVVDSTTLGLIGEDAARALEAELGSWRATALARPLQRV